MSSDFDTLFGILAVFFGVMLFILAVSIIICIIGNWLIFSKAGIDGWKALIPFYNSYCLAQMAFGNGLFFLLAFIPYANFIYSLILGFMIAKSFGKGTGFSILTALFTPIMFIIIGLSDDAQYIGPQKF